MKRAKQDPRFCNTMDEFEEHLESVEKDKNKNQAPCQMCGQKTLWECMKCGVRCCSHTAKWDGLSCFRRFHNLSYFGCARCDSKSVHNVNQSDWNPPNPRQLNNNKRDVELILQEIDNEEVNDDTSGR